MTPLCSCLGVQGVAGCGIDGLGHYSLLMKSIWSLLFAASAQNCDEEIALADSRWIDSPGTKDMPSLAETSLPLPPR